MCYFQLRSIFEKLLTFVRSSVCSCHLAIKLDFSESTGQISFKFIFIFIWPRKILIHLKLYLNKSFFKRFKENLEAKFDFSLIEIQKFDPHLRISHMKAHMKLLFGDCTKPIPKAKIVSCRTYPPSPICINLSNFHTFSN